mgnify:CR=1 FL=1
MGCSLENIAMKRGNYRCVAYLFSHIHSILMKTIIPFIYFISIGLSHGV